MKYIRLALGMMKKRWLFTVIIVLEIAILLILTNIMIATANSKYMLYEPYKNLLTENGIVLDVASLNMLECDNDDIKPFLEKFPDLRSVEKFLEKKLDVKIYHSDEFSFKVQTGPRSAMYRDRGNMISYILLDKDILEKWKLPLSCGRYPLSERNADGEIEILISGGTDAGLNQIYDTPSGKMRVVGILTDNTYKPVASSTNDDGIRHGVDFESIFNYCVPLDIGTNLGGPFAIASKELFPQGDTGYGTDGYNIIPNSIWFVTYGNVSEEDFKSKTEYLSTVGMIRPNQTLATLAQATEQKINDIYYRMFPMIITAVIMVLLGSTGSSAISAIRQIRTFGIFFLCGCRKKDCIFIMSAEMLITLFLSIILAVTGIIIMQKFNFEYLIGMTFGMMNIIVSVSLIALIFILSLILPFGIIKTSSPVLTLKERV